MEQGKFIVLEGIDGSGTSTQGPLLVKYLFDKDKRNIVVLTREPNELNPEGEEVRRRLQKKLLPEEQDIHDPLYWTNLFIANREGHAKFFSPLLKLGLQTISDRYKLSTIAYQSAQGMDMDGLIKRHEGLPIPDLTLLLDISTQIAQKRMDNSRQEREYFEEIDFQEKVQQNYLLAAQKLSASERIVVIDGSKPIEDVAKEIQQEVNKLYGYQ